MHYAVYWVAYIDVFINTLKQKAKLVVTSLLINCACFCREDYCVEYAEDGCYRRNQPACSCPVTCSRPQQTELGSITVRLEKSRLAPVGAAPERTRSLSWRRRTVEQGSTSSIRSRDAFQITHSWHYHPQCSVASINEERKRKTKLSWTFTKWARPSWNGKDCEIAIQGTFTTWYSL